VHGAQIRKACQHTPHNDVKTTTLGSAVAEAGKLTDQLHACDGSRVSAPLAHDTKARLPPGLHYVWGPLDRTDLVPLPHQTKFVATARAWGRVAGATPGSLVAGDPGESGTQSRRWRQPAPTRREASDTRGPLHSREQRSVVARKELLAFAILGRRTVKGDDSNGLRPVPEGFAPKSDLAHPFRLGGQKARPKAGQNDVDGDSNDANSLRKAEVAEWQTRRTQNPLLARV